LHCGEIGELLDPSALEFVPSVSLAADNAYIAAFPARHGMARGQSVGLAPKQTSNDDRKVQLQIPRCSSAVA
jgi:hypothetical protein